MVVDGVMRWWCVNFMWWYMLLVLSSCGTWCYVVEAVLVVHGGCGTDDIWWCLYMIGGIWHVVGLIHGGDMCR